jgi:hypothetical protein
LKEGDNGTKAFDFVVILSAQTNVDVTVVYSTANGTATAGSDYLSSGGTLTIPAGATVRTITLLVTGDSIFEADETFFVNLSSATNATIQGFGQGTGTIRNDDKP